MAITKDVMMGKTLRKSFAKQDQILEIPNMLKIQKDSYEWFLREGLREVFRDVDTITDYTGNLELSFLDYSMNEPPKYSEEECKARDATYAAPLKVSVRLRNRETEEIKEQEIFMGDFPLMTASGTFIINGAERVIVSQIVRSPGVYYDKKTDKAYNSTYGTTVIPYHGAWLEYETDLNDIFNCRIDKNRKLPVTWFIKAMGAYKADNPNTWLSCIPDMTTGVVTNEQIKESLVGAGNNAVVVQLYQDNYPYEVQYNGVPAGVYPITEETRQELCKIDHVKGVSLFCSRNYADGVYYGNNSFSGNLYGIDEYYFDVNGYSLDHGRSFLKEDFAKAKKVCMLDTAAASALFSGEDPVGKTVEMQGDSFTVVGVVKRARSTTMQIKTPSDYYQYMNETGTIFLPLKTWPMLYSFDEPQCAALRADNTDNMTSVGQKAGELLSSSQLIGADKTLSYRGQDLMEQAKNLQELSNSSNRQLIWIASISLLVGGIGVMNIMMVSVTERTREIGIRKALGAKERVILSQFVVEAATTSALGGVLGIVLGYIVSMAANRILPMISSSIDVTVSPSFNSIVVAFGISVGIGVLFGYLPAKRAARLNPIDALRYD